MVIFLSACIEGILQLFTNFYLHREFSISLGNDRDCKVVDPYECKKEICSNRKFGSYENIPWLLSCFCKIKKPNKKFS
jgi:hypothetical protein